MNNLTSEVQEQEFAQLLIDALRSGGEQGSIQFDPAACKLIFDDGDPRAIYVGDDYSFYLATSVSDRPKAVATFAEGWRETRQHSKRSYAEVQSRLRFRLAPHVDLGPELSAPARDETARIALGPHLDAELVVDGERTMQHVKQSQLDSWGIGLDEAVSTARDNLRPISLNCAFLEHQNRTGLCLSPWMDNYDAARVMLPEIFEGLRLQGDPVVLTPNRDRLLVAGSRDAKALRHMAAFAEELAKEPRFIGAVPLVLVRGQWEIFDPGSIVNASAREAFARLFMRTLALRYSRQEFPLHEALRRTGRLDVSCGHLFLAGTTPVQTTAVWSPTPPLAIPVGQTVAFTDSSVFPSRYLGSAPWDRVISQLRHLMTPLGTDPERYLVSTFPSEVQLQSLKLVKETLSLVNGPSDNKV